MVDLANMVRFVIGALEPPFPARRKALSLIRCCAGAVRETHGMADVYFLDLGEGVSIMESHFSRNLLPSSGLSGSGRINKSIVVWVM